MVQITPRERIEINAYGDLIGKGIWTFYRDHMGYRVSFDCDIDFGKKYLAGLTPIFRPIFRWNHRWAMNKGLESLKLEVLRRRGVKDVPPPPKATWPY